MEALDDNGNIWQTFVFKGCRAFVRFRPFVIDRDSAMTVVDVAVTRNGDWRLEIDQPFIVTARNITSSAPRQLQTHIMRTVFGLIRMLDSDLAINPEGIYAPVIAELTALTP